MKKNENDNKKINYRKSKPPKRKLSKSFKKFISLLFILSVAIALIAFVSSSDMFKEFFDNRYQVSPTPTPGQQTDSSPSPTPIPDLSANASIAFVGDILMHDSLIEGGLNESGSYSYNYMFAKIKDIIQGIDYSIADYEGVLAGEPYSGWPYFNAPDTIAQAIALAGFDMVTTANNHSYDKAMTGLTRTAQVFKSQEVEVIGTRSEPTDPTFEIIDINGIKVGFTAYTYETVGEEDRRALNAIPMMDSAYPLVDSFNPYRPERFEQDKLGMAQRADQMRNAGAECLVFVMHWGDEYHTNSNYWQREIAQVLADKGVEIIFGTHPHVIQEISVVNSQDKESSTLVYYSTGNFISNMGFGANDGLTQGKAEDGIIAKATIKRDTTGNISVTKGEYIPVYTLKDDTQGKRIHTVIPVDYAIEDPESYGVTNFIDLIKASNNRTTNFLEDSNGTFNGITISKYTP